jgi:hypothetical protein
MAVRIRPQTHDQLLERVTARLDFFEHQAAAARQNLHNALPRDPDLQFHKDATAADQRIAQAQMATDPSAHHVQASVQAALVDVGTKLAERIDKIGVGGVTVKEVYKVMDQTADRIKATLNASEDAFKPLEDLNNALTTYTSRMGKTGQGHPVANTMAQRGADEVLRSTEQINSANVRAMVREAVRLREAQALLPMFQQVTAKLKEGDHAAAADIAEHFATTAPAVAPATPTAAGPGMATTPPIGTPAVTPAVHPGGPAPTQPVVIPHPGPAQVNAPTPVAPAVAQPGVFLNRAQSEELTDAFYEKVQAFGQKGHELTDAINAGRSMAEIHQLRDEFNEQARPLFVLGRLYMGELDLNGRDNMRAMLTHADDMVQYVADNSRGLFLREPINHPADQVRHINRNSNFIVRMFQGSPTHVSAMGLLPQEVNDAMILHLPAEAERRTLHQWIQDDYARLGVGVPGGPVGNIFTQTPGSILVNGPASGP